MKTTFGFNFDLYQAFNQPDYTNMEAKRSCSFKKLLFIILVIKLVIRKKLVTIKTMKKSSSLYCYYRLPP